MKKLLSFVSTASLLLVSNYSLAANALECPAAESILITQGSDSKYVVTPPDGYSVVQIADITKVNHIGFVGAEVLLKTANQGKIDQLQCFYGQDADNSGNIGERVFALSLTDENIKNVDYQPTGTKWTSDDSNTNPKLPTVLINNPRKFSCIQEKFGDNYAYTNPGFCRLSPL